MKKPNQVTRRWLLAADSPIEVPPQIIASRAERLITLSDRDQLSATAWRNIGWKTDFETSLVHFDEIFSGGVPRDGIPPIDEPQFTDFAEAIQFVAGREPVVVGWDPPSPALCDGTAGEAGGSGPPAWVCSAP